MRDFPHAIAGFLQGWPDAVGQDVCILYHLSRAGEEEETFDEVLNHPMSYPSMAFVLLVPARRVDLRLRTQRR